MASDVDSGALGDFLAAHKPVELLSAFASGDVFGDWRVTAFLGRGGSGEVYRVVHATLGTVAALKVCVRNAERDDTRDAAVCGRFVREARLLAKNTHPAFPRFLGYGVRDSRPWYVMELLEHKPLPTAGKDVARFLLAVASGVRHLHSLGFVHRDIKPSNILWRNSAPVLIDLGLVKDTSAERGHAGDTLSIVDGKAIGVGTPPYAAPEQLTGDEITPVTDVYALGMLANDCFSGKPPRTWRRIIQRATAAVPAQRYATADAFILAVRRRNLARTVGLSVAAMSVVVFSAVVIMIYCRQLTANEEEQRSVEHEEIQEMLMRDVY
jgi:serine/threonine-protein kinase